MSIDTRNKRMSLIGFGIPVPSMLPNPDGVFDVRDRLHLIFLYSGFAVIPAVAGGIVVEPPRVVWERKFAKVTLNVVVYRKVIAKHLIALIIWQRRQLITKMNVRVLGDVYVAFDEVPHAYAAFEDVHYPIITHEEGGYKIVSDDK